MLYVYARRASNGARDLSEEILLKGLRARRTLGDRLRTLVSGDLVVCWGAHFTAPTGVRTLNNVEPISKFTEAQRLAQAGVATIEVSQTRPAVQNAPRAPFVASDFDLTRWRGINALNFANATVLSAEVSTYLNQVAQARRAYESARVPASTTEWLPRRNNHVGGSDLLRPDPNTANFWSKKENITEEYRIHMFRGRSIRAGIKVPQGTRDGRPIAAHPWIRSYDAGWIIRYDGFNSTEQQRELAKRAVEALGLDFGAVDMGRKADGSLIVLEVNRAPGIEGNSVGAYDDKIIAWANGTDEQRPRRRRTT